MRTGWIEFWKSSYGFVHTTDGASYFVHVSNCMNFTPQKGVWVTFDEGHSSKGAVAINVRLMPVATGGARHE